MFGVRVGPTTPRSWFRRSAARTRRPKVPSISTPGTTDSRTSKVPKKHDFVPKLSSMVLPKTTGDAEEPKREYRENVEPGVQANEGAKPKDLLQMRWQQEKVEKSFHFGMCRLIERVIQRRSRAVFRRRVGTR